MSCANKNHSTYQKKKIPKKVKEEVWVSNFGYIYESKCFIYWCSNKVNVFNFHVGHDIPESKGGTNNILNLKPICDRCNLSMGSHTTITTWNKSWSNNLNGNLNGNLNDKEYYHYKYYNLIYIIIIIVLIYNNYLIKYKLLNIEDTSNISDIPTISDINVFDYNRNDTINIKYKGLYNNSTFGTCIYNSTHCILSSLCNYSYNIINNYL